jgi:flagellar biosynthetic protein FlhB
MSGSEEQSPGDKEHAPSQKKLDDARRQGDIAKSTELSAAAAYSGLLVAALVGGAAVTAAASAGAVLLDQAPALAALASAAAHPVLGGLLAATIFPLALFLALPALFSLGTLLAQRGIVIAPEKLKPKLSRISPLAMAKQKFGPEGLFEFAKSFVKLILVSLVLAYFMIGHADTILASAATDPRLGILNLLELMGWFLGIVIVLTAAIGVIDLLWQRHALMQRNRMTRQEMLDEMKDSEGDPQTKAQRRQRGQEIAMNQMLAEVGKANVVIVNPTHYAVALKWQRGARSAPIVVAKGVDEVARKIRECAAESGVPIHSDPPTARAIHASVDLGNPIRPDHYRAVAAAIRFAEAMRKRAKGRMS